MTTASTTTPRCERGEASNKVSQSCHPLLSQVSDDTEVRESDGVLYVRQKEDAVTFDGDRLQDGNPVRCCGTEDVLTCHVVVLHHPEARVTAIAHFDEYVKEARLKRYQHYSGVTCISLLSLIL